MCSLPFKWQEQYVLVALLAFARQLFGIVYQMIYIYVTFLLSLKNLQTCLFHTSSDI